MFLHSKSDKRSKHDHAIFNLLQADETTESGQNTNTGNADSERIVNENANQTTIQENQPSSSPVFDSLSNILIGLIFAVIGFIVYRRVFWL